MYARPWEEGRQRFAFAGPWHDTELAVAEPNQLRDVRGKLAVAVAFEAAVDKRVRMLRS